jgi:perosamine synthetase
MKSKTLPDLVTQAIQDIMGNCPSKLHGQTFDGNETKYVQACIESNYVSSVGNYVDQFEIELARYAGARHAISIINGTSALHLALKFASVCAGD